MAGISQKKKGIIWNALGSSIYGLNTFVMIAAVNRLVQDVAETGAFSIAFTTAQMLFILGVFGANHTQMTDYSHGYSFEQYRKLKIITTVCMLPSAFILFLMGLGSSNFVYLLGLTVLMALNAWGELYQSLFFQHNRLDLSGQALFFRTLFSLSAFVLAMLLTHGSIGLSLVAAIVINACATWYYDVRHAPRFSYEASGKSFKALVLACTPLFFSVFLMNAIINIPKYGVELLMNDTATGYFNLIFIPVQIINLISQFIFRPALSKYAQLIETHDNKGFGKQLRKQIIMICFITVLGAGMAYLMGPEVLGMLYKADLSPYRIELTVLIAGSGFFALSILGYYIMIFLHYNTRIMVLYVVCAMAEVGACSWLIPQYGLIGAVISFVVAHIILIGLYTMNIWKGIRHEEN